eukprot:TRINITY_DN3750_c0_g1_i2.p1 TRINITY_DN3750_c0_g1~~TRINITY_DN3750_c0_g1_i2.p1  ORF type:complete len:187 (-),score=25.34 TRINITY_DN3750_c0_g1_i2:16-576(-)
MASPSTPSPVALQPTVTYSSSALHAVVLHSIRFLALQVDGVLLGHVNGKDIQVVKAIPLFHGPGPLAPMLQLAMIQVERFAVNNSLSLVGVYHAASQLPPSRDPPPLSPIARMIAEKVLSNSEGEQVCVIEVDNHAIRVSPTSAPFVCYSRISSPASPSTSKWLPVDPISLSLSPEDNQMEAPGEG